MPVGFFYEVNKVTPFFPMTLKKAILYPIYTPNLPIYTYLLTLLTLLNM